MPIPRREPMTPKSYVTAGCLVPSPFEDSCSAVATALKAGSAGAPGESEFVSTVPSSQAMKPSSQSIVNLR